MASSDQGRDRWLEDGSAAASGGHVSPNYNDDESFLKALSDPLPDDEARPRRRPPGPAEKDPSKLSTSDIMAGRSEAETKMSRDPMEVLDRPLPSETVQRAGATTEIAPRTRVPPERRRRSAARTRPAVRRVRRTIKHVEPWSVLKLSLFFYALLMVVWLLVVAVLYSIVDALGVFENIERIGDAFNYDITLDITLGLVERYAFLLGLIGVITGSIVNVIVAVLYNLGTDLVGGIETTFVEKGD